MKKGTTTSQVLRETKKYIEKHGCGSSWWNGNGSTRSLCIEGVMQKVLGTEDRTTLYAHPAYQVLLEAADTRLTALHVWYDQLANHRRKEVVLAALEKALKVANGVPMYDKEHYELVQNFLAYKKRQAAEAEAAAKQKATRIHVLAA